MSFGSSILCIITCGLYPYLWDIIKQKLNFKDWTLKQQIFVGVMFTLLFVQVILIGVLVVRNRGLLTSLLDQS